jgi:type IV secretion system protein VirB9
VTNHGSFITVKPRERSPETNFVVVTDRRTYVFDLRAKMPVTGRPPAAYATDVDQVFLLRFRYPQDERLAQDAARASMDAQSSAEAARKRRAGEIAQLPAKPRNTQYFYEGPAALAPYEAWDDGTFTYLRFYAQVDLPTPFVVNEDGSESTANKHFERDVMVIERVARRFVLRKGTTVVCLYNEGPLAQSPQPDTGSTERGGRRVIR